MGNETNINPPVPAEWSEKLGIAVAIVEEVENASLRGWAKDANGNKRQLAQHEKRSLVLLKHQTGLSILGGQIIWLGDTAYITKPGKVSMARRDPDIPLRKVSVRPATKEEREMHGIVEHVCEKPREFEFLAYAEIYAMMDGKMEIVSDGFGHANYNNINLKGKDKECFRLCKDMAETRAVSRALSVVYDSFGLPSYEEVAQGNTFGAPEPRVVIETDAEVVEPDKGEPGTLITAESIRKLIDDNAKLLPDAIATGTKFSLERLKKYNVEGLATTYENIEEKIKKAQKDSGGQKAESGSDVPEATPETGKDNKGGRSRSKAPAGS